MERIAVSGEVLLESKVPASGLPTGLKDSAEAAAKGYSKVADMRESVSIVVKPSAHLGAEWVDIGIGDKSWTDIRSVEYNFQADTRSAWQQQLIQGARPAHPIIVDAS